MDRKLSASLPYRVVIPVDLQASEEALDLIAFFVERAVIFDLIRRFARPGITG